MAQRKDAARTRRAILDAAQELLQADQEASHAEIAAAAGVGRASIYRHFPERSDLVAALLGEMLGRLEGLASAREGTVPLVDLLRATTREQARCQGLISIMRRDGVAPAQLDELSERVLALYAEPLAYARREGIVRGDLSLDEVPLVLTMVEGALAPITDPIARGQTASRALDLVLQGLLAS